MVLPICGLIFGLMLGAMSPFMIPYAFAKLFSVILLVALDSAFGGMRSYMGERFDSTVLLTGFFTNAMLAVFLVYVGDKVGIDLYYVALLAFGFRIFQNMAVLRRYLLKRHHAN